MNIKMFFVCFNTDGACGYGSFATDLMSSGEFSVATASAKIYKEGKGCGACYQVCA